jgi:CheY-like chemotaxis protein
MSKGFDFLWIDDEKHRETTAVNLEKSTGAKVHFYNVTNEDLAERIGPLLHKHSPDLVIVDHNLDKTIGPLRNELKSTGASVAELIKDSHPQLPVVCVTKVDRDKDITFAQKSAYDEIFSATHLTRQNPVFISIAEGFRNINRRPIKKVTELLKRLGCPEVDLARLMQVLPKEIRTEFADPGYSSILWRWISGVLFARPGFLYDSMWAATLVGAKESSFLKAQEKMKTAMYGGIFANEVEPRWWVSKILEILYKNSPDGKQDDPRLLGRAYLDIPKKGYSKCEISLNDLPDTVAFTDATDTKRRQVCMKFTKEHPGFQKLLFFEDVLIIRED